MTTSPRISGPARQISGPAELLQAIPYLLGFHPQQSLVLIGLDAGRLVVTARLDLADVLDAHATAGPDRPSVLADTVAAVHRGGATDFVAAVFADPGAPDPASGWRSALTDSLQRCLERRGCDLLDVLLVRSGRYRSLYCDTSRCCPPDGLALPDAPSSFAVAATYDGIVALPNRAALEAVLDPLGETQRRGCEPMLQAAERAAVAAAADGHGARLTRSRTRGLFAAARSSAVAGWSPPGPAEVSRYAVALGEVAVRDSLWAAIDDRRIDGRPLWREIAGQVPSPYDAAPLFLFGWAAWRSGDGALAGIAADRAVASDPGFHPADLLRAALAGGFDPRQVPRIRFNRSA